MQGLQQQEHDGSISVQYHKIHSDVHVRPLVSYLIILLVNSYHGRKHLKNVFVNLFPKFGHGQIAVSIVACIVINAFRLQVVTYMKRINR